MNLPCHSFLLCTPFNYRLRIPILLLILCFALSPHAAEPPGWWVDRTFQPDVGEVIGYGAGPDLPTAITAALGDAAYQRRALIRASTQLSSFDTGRVDRRSSSRIAAYGTLVATHSRVLRQVVQPDGSVYVSVASVSLESEQLLAYLARHSGLDPCASSNATNLLLGSKLLRDVQESFGCDPGLRLRYGPDGWTLSLGSLSARLDVARLPDAFADFDQPALRLSLDPIQGSPQQLFRLTWLSSTQGTLTAVLVDDLGAVRLLGRSSTSSVPSGSLEFDVAPASSLHLNPSLVLAAVCPFPLSPPYMVSSGSAESAIGARPAFASLLDELQGGAHCTYASLRLPVSP